MDKCSSALQDANRVLRARDGAHHPVVGPLGAMVQVILVSGAFLGLRFLPSHDRPVQAVLPVAAETRIFTSGAPEERQETVAATSLLVPAYQAPTLSREKPILANRSNETPPAFAEGKSQAGLPVELGDSVLGGAGRTMVNSGDTALRGFFADNRKKMGGDIMTVAPPWEAVGPTWATGQGMTLAGQKSAPGLASLPPMGGTGWGKFPLALAARHPLTATALATTLRGRTPLSRAATTVGWTSWSSRTSSNALGTITLPTDTITVTYTGEVVTQYTQLNGGANHWTPLSSFTGPTIANGPTNGNLIAIDGGSSRVDTITFSRPIVNPSMAFWSVGSPTIAITYNFNQPFTIVAGGPSSEIGGSSIYLPDPNTPMIMGGKEGNGVITFFGTYSSLSWTVPTGEIYHGFTVGAPALSSVPEPASMALLTGALGLVLPGIGCALLRRRRDAATHFAPSIALV